MTAQQLISCLRLKYLEGEGGYFTRIYLGSKRTDSQRRIGSSILYLATYESFSSLHRLAEDEIWHYCMGDPAQQLLLNPDGSGEMRLFGSDITSGQMPASVVSGGTWQAVRPMLKGQWTLFGVTMPLAYEQHEFERGNAEHLKHQYPEYRHHIERMAEGEVNEFP